MRAMEMRLSVTGVAQTIRAAEAVERLSRALKGAMPGNLSLGGSAGTGRGSPASAKVLGAYGRLGNAQSNLSMALASGNPLMIADAQAAMVRAQRAVQSQQNLITGPTFAQRLQKWGYSSRFGQGGLMPLAGQTLDLLGLGKLAGPIGLVVAGLGLFKKALDAAIEGARQYQQLRGISGGSPKDIEAAKVYASAGGMTPEELASRARAAQDAYYSNSPEGNTLRQLGAKSPGYGPNRDPNAMPWFMDAVKKALAIKDRDARLRALQNLGVAGLDEVRNPEILDRMAKASKPVDPNSKALAYGFDMALNRISDNFKKFGINPIAWSEDLIGTINAANGRGVDNIQNKQLGELKKISDGVYKLANERTSFGGGEGLKGAVPSGWQWITNSDDAVQRQAMALGAFRI